MSPRHALTRAADRVLAAVGWVWIQCVRVGIAISCRITAFRKTGLGRCDIAGVTAEDELWGWYHRVFLVTAIVAMGGAGLSLLFGPETWQQSASINAAKDVIPIQAIAAGYLVITALLMNWRTRPVAYAITAFYVAFFLIQVWLFSALAGKPTNIAIVWFLLMALMGTVAGFRFSVSAYRKHRSRAG